MYSFKSGFLCHFKHFDAQTVQTVQTVIMQKRYSYTIPYITILLVYNLIGIYLYYYKMYSLYNIPFLSKLMHRITVIETVQTFLPPTKTNP